jgi:hypothetical protein
MEPVGEYHQPARYEIRVMGVLDASWSDWFDGLTVVPQSTGETVLMGLVRDQTALHGLLGKIRDMGLPLLLVRRMSASS